jgi:hypothetical protein
MLWRRVKRSRPVLGTPEDDGRLHAPFAAHGVIPCPLEQGLTISAPSIVPPRLSTLPGEITQPATTDGGLRPVSGDAAGWRRYLHDRENDILDIDQLDDLLGMPEVLLEIGCGNAEAARLIAFRNPHLGVIAIDLYDWRQPQTSKYSYGQVAREWRARCLPSQINPPANLVVLRAETELLPYLPMRSIDTVFLINPEPRVGKLILALLQHEPFASRIKPGPARIVVLPYSREMGLMACGGCGFEHDPDWSRGLGFIMGSGLRFRRGAPVQWGVDLPRVSAYTGNSTQRDVYICGDLAD